jgi:23S rRNA pseudouridine1911/1915/1917 synthase
VDCLDLLCEDGPLFAVNKPAGIPTQAPPGIDSLEARVKEYLKRKYAKPGNVYLGMPHRLDRPVSGVVLFARNSKAAARLAEQFRLRQVRKFYLAVVEGCPDPADGTFSDCLLKEPGLAQMNVVPEGTPGAKPATLKYRVLRPGVIPGAANGGPCPNDVARACALVLVEPLTGRMHQIRVQFASRGWPVVGDRRYGARCSFPTVDAPSEESFVIALHAARLDLRHPVRYDPISLVAPLPESWSAFNCGEFDGDHTPLSSM